MTPPGPADTAPNPPRPTLAVGLAIWFAAIVALAGFIAIGAALKLAPLYAGFLFAWYWLGLEQGQLKLAPATLIGAVAGVATSGLTQYATLYWGAAGGAAVLVLILVALLALIMGWLPLVINQPYFLFLTVTGAPLLQGGEDFRAVVAALALGAAYFCGLAFIATRIGSMRARRASAA